MAFKLVRFLFAAMLGLFLVAQSVVAVSPQGAAGAQAALKCAMCDCHHCGTPACCLKSKTPSIPPAPASPASTSQNQNEWQALVSFTVRVLPLPAFPAGNAAAKFSVPASLTAVPLFQRDCCYLV